MDRPLVLASASPRRRDILLAAGFRFEVRPARIPEERRRGEAPDAYVARLAAEKARAVWRQGELVMGADTVVCAGGEVLEKPVDEDDARRMLRLLSGRTHEVLTGYCLYDGERTREGVECTKVRFLPLSDEEMEAYIASGEPLDKAGAYAIQGLASKFVDRVEGCYFNVVGLPMARIYNFIRSNLR